MFQKEFLMKIGLSSLIQSKFPVFDTPINNKLSLCKNLDQN